MATNNKQRNAAVPGLVTQESNNQVVLPYLTSADVDFKLQEIAQQLTEWEQLLDRSIPASADINNTSVSIQDLNRHLNYKKGINDTLSMLVRMVHVQTKIKQLRETMSQPTVANNNNNNSSNNSNNTSRSNPISDPLKHVPVTTYQQQVVPNNYSQQLPNPSYLSQQQYYLAGAMPGGAVPASGGDFANPLYPMLTGNNAPQHLEPLQYQMPYQPYQYQPGQQIPTIQQQQQYLQQPYGGTQCSQPQPNQKSGTYSTLQQPPQQHRK